MDGGAAPGIGAGGEGEGGVTGGTGGEGTGAGGAPTWFSGLDGDAQGWMQNKGYFGPDLAKADLAKGMPELVKAFRGLEGMVGRDKVVWPKDSADTQAWSEIHKRLGVPAKWEEYGIVPMGADGKPDEKADRSYANGMAQIFQKAGIGKEAAHTIAAEHSRLTAALQAADNEAFTRQSTADVEALEKEWGQEASRKFAAGQAAAHAFGLDAGTMGKIERAIGTKPMLDLLSRIGAAISEDYRGEGSGFGPTGLQSPQGAAARMKELMSDSGWVAKYNAGDRTAIEEWNRLERVKAGMGSHAA
jgi:hypothetical protein